MLPASSITSHIPRKSCKCNHKRLFNFNFFYIVSLLLIIICAMLMVKNGLPWLLADGWNVCRLLVLDEVDQLGSRNQAVLYTVFEWPALTGSQLTLVGIANSLDLTDRLLPRLQAHTSCRPHLLHYAPYTKQQISNILNHRLQEVSNCRRMCWQTDSFITCLLWKSSHNVEFKLSNH